MRLCDCVTSCDLLKIHYLCGDKDNRCRHLFPARAGCDLLKIHYLCGDKDNDSNSDTDDKLVVICSKFITFAVTKTTNGMSKRDAL